MLTRVEVNVSLVSEHNFYIGPTRRVDSGGVFIATAMPPPVGTRLQVRLGLADGRKLDLEGEVAFVREKSATTGRQPSGCGVKLHGLPGLGHRLHRPVRAGAAAAGVHAVATSKRRTADLINVR